MQNGPVTPPQTDVQAVMTMRIIWFALLMSQVMLFVVSFIILPPSEAVNTNVAQMFFGMGVIALVLSFVVPRFLSKSLAVPGDKITIATLFTPFIISLALNEACAVMGFLVKRVTNDTPISLALFIGSTLVYLSRFPVESKLKDQVEILKNQQG